MGTLRLSWDTLWGLLKLWQKISSSLLLRDSGDRQKIPVLLIITLDGKQLEIWNTTHNIVRSTFTSHPLICLRLVVFSGEQGFCTIWILLGHFSKWNLDIFAHHGYRNWEEVHYMFCGSLPNSFCSLLSFPCSFFVGLDFALGLIWIRKGLICGKV